MGEHITADELQRFRSGDLTAGRVTTVARHLGECLPCAALGRQIAGASGSQSALLALGGAPNHLTEEMLSAFVDGTLSTEERQSADTHLRSCAMCRAEAEDLNRYSTRLAESGRSPRRWLVAAALLVVVAIGASVLLRPGTRKASELPRRQSVSTATPARRADWDALVAGALASERFPPPSFLREIRGTGEQVRGDAVRPTHAALQPSGVVVETDRPRFKWAMNGRPARVDVFDGAHRIAESGDIAGSEWVPRDALPRGKTYEWQVELRNGARRIVPTPPDPPAVFHVMDEASFRALQAARSERPGDHLLLAVLYARAGAQREALTELAAYRGAHPDDRAQRLAESIARW